MYVRIVSKRKGGTAAQPGETVIAVDRSNRILGNKAVLADHTDLRARQRAIASFSKQCDEDVERNGPMSQEIERLANLLEVVGQPLALQCWCAPLACHAEVIRMHLELRLNRNLTPPDERQAQPSSTSERQVPLF